MLHYLIAGVFLLIAGCASSKVFYADPADLIRQAEQDLSHAQAAASRQISARPETIIAEEQLKKAKDLENLRSEIIARDAANTKARKITANDVNLAAMVSSINSKIVIIKARTADLADENNKLELELANLQAEANKQWSEISKAQIELGVSSKADLEKKLEEEHQARIKISEQLEANQKAKEEAIRRAEALKQTEFAEVKLSIRPEDYKRQQTELLQKLSFLKQELIGIKEEQRGIIISLSGTFFDTDKITLQPGNAEKLTPFAQLLKDYPERNILVEGYADDTGSSDHNQMLSEKRAYEVKAYLVGKGVNPDKIAARGYGNKALPANATAEGFQPNRRVDIVILNPAGLL